MSSFARINPETGLAEIFGGYSRTDGLLGRGPIEQGDDMRPVPSTDQPKDWSQPQITMGGTLPKGYYSGLLMELINMEKALMLKRHKSFWIPTLIT